MGVILLLCIIHVVWADNVDVYHENSKIEFHGPPGLRNESLFGYSTAYDRYNKRLIISAPRENSIGEVYDCNITSNSCSKIVNRIKMDGQYKHDYWFGATVRAGSTFIVACAPRFTGPIKNSVVMQGRCYKRNQDRDKFVTILRTSSGETSYEQDMETLGWDLDIGPDNYMIVGGPGMYKKKGLAAFKHFRSDKLLRMGANTDVSFNFGFSVAVGYFTEQDKLSFAVGSTYGTKGPGQIFCNYQEQLPDFAILPVIG